MATYTELRGLFGHNELKNKIEVACIVAAETIRTDAAPPANQAAWWRETQKVKTSRPLHD